MMLGILGLLQFLFSIPMWLYTGREFSRRSAQRAACARSLGLKYSYDKKRKSILNKRFMPSLTLFTKQGPDVIWGRWRGLPVRYADYRHVAPTTNGQALITDYSAACATLNINAPYLLVRRKRSRRPLASRFRNRGADSSFGYLGSEFRVNSRNREFPEKLLDADMMAWLRSADANLTFGVHGKQLVVWRVASAGSASLPQLFDAAVEFAAHIPQVVLDEYSLTARPSSTLPSLILGKYQVWPRAGYLRSVRLPSETARSCALS